MGYRVQASFADWSESDSTSPSRVRSYCALCHADSEYNQFCNAGL